MFGTRGARYGQLLLFAALLFGILTMHTVGHPAELSGPGAAATTASHPMTANAMAPSHPVAAQTTHPVAADAMHPDARRPADQAPMRGMDPMAVCLAVLSVWGLALLTTLLVARRSAAGLPGTAGPRSSWRPRPPPPPRPRKAVLTGLSVLRI
ncbi:hypothetical protein FHX80_111102 [Streptomyces brevispora]|uniref:Uncharacterized protein n=1 Tax=Streptomyces brevispora TaxID=887462 RepID=A0A561UTK0_9ACTN|nr:DUF6153 family protein [Streptomyces brevispora]TWG02692.1 hypothetical protein FHX80_111102 [Streptomyces brevispora]